MLDLEVVPKKSLGGEQWQFVLGMPLSQAIEILKRQCSVIKKVQLRYSDQRPLDIDLVVDLINNGIRLLFDAKCQRLKMIEIYDVKKVKLKYCATHFSSPDITPTVRQVNESFGPTIPGQVDTKQQLYLLSYTGILFAFPVWTADITDLTTGSPDLSELESQRSLVLSQIRIFSGSDITEARAPSIPLECFHGNCYSDSMEMVRENGVIVGVRVQLITDDSHYSKLGEPRPNVLHRQVTFGDSVQDTVCALGAPSKVFFKAEDKMRIHSPSPHKLPTARSSDYFYNYFTLGLDVLFDANTHSVKKFVMHTNPPGHYNFNIYYRCNFLIKFPLDQQVSSEDSIKPTSELIITPSTKWSEVQDYFTHPTDKPVVLNRSSSTNSINPFGSTYCYGYQNVIFEVMKNHHIASVTVYSLPPQSR